MEPDRTARTSAGADAFRRYVVPELSVLLRVARRITGDPTDAEDLVQEALLAPTVLSTGLTAATPEHGS